MVLIVTISHYKTGSKVVGGGVKCHQLQMLFPILDCVASARPSGALGPGLPEPTWAESALVGLQPQFWYSGRARAQILSPLNTQARLGSSGRMPEARPDPIERIQEKFFFFFLVIGICTLAKAHAYQLGNQLSYNFEQLIIAFFILKIIIQSGSSLSFVRWAGLGSGKALMARVGLGLMV